jgi:hypothetical protein
MKRFLWAAVAAGFSTAAVAGTPCDQVKSQIEAKIKAHGVSQYVLDIVPAGQSGEGKVVGSCEGGKKSVVYERGHVEAKAVPTKPAAAPAAPAAAKPAPAAAAPAPKKN